MLPLVFAQGLDDNIGAYTIESIVFVEGEVVSSIERSTPKDSLGFECDLSIGFLLDILHD